MCIWIDALHKSDQKAFGLLLVLASTEGNKEIYIIRTPSLWKELYNKCFYEMGAFYHYISGLGKIKILKSRLFFLSLFKGWWFTTIYNFQRPVSTKSFWTFIHFCIFNIRKRKKYWSQGGDILNIFLCALKLWIIKASFISLYWKHREASIYQGAFCHI